MNTKKHMMPEPEKTFEKWWGMQVIGLPPPFQSPVARDAIKLFAQHAYMQGMLDLALHFEEKRKV